MKITVELISEKFIYDYKIGDTSAHGELALTAGSIMSFCSILEKCYSVREYNSREYKDEIMAKMFIEKNLDKAKKYIDEIQSEGA